MTRSLLACGRCTAVLDVADADPTDARRWAARHGWSCTLADLTRPGAGVLDLCPACTARRDVDQRAAVHRTEQLTSALEHGLQAAGNPADPHVYVCPVGELDARTAVLGLARPVRLFVSPLVPPGELRIAPAAVDDPRAREVYP